MAGKLGLDIFLGFVISDHVKRIVLSDHAKQSLLITLSDNTKKYNFSSFWSSTTRFCVFQNITPNDERKIWYDFVRRTLISCMYVMHTRLIGIINVKLEPFTAWTFYVSYLDY